METRGVRENGLLRAEISLRHKADGALGLRSLEELQVPQIVQGSRAFLTAQMQAQIG